MNFQVRADRPRTRQASGKRKSEGGPEGGFVHEGQSDQRVDLENPFDQHRPSLAGAGAGRRRFGGRTGRASRLLRRNGFGLLPPQTSTLVRVPAVITNQVRALGWNGVPGTPGRVNSARKSSGSRSCLLVICQWSFVSCRGQRTTEQGPTAARTPGSGRGRSPRAGHRTSSVHFLSSTGLPRGPQLPAVPPVRRPQRRRRRPPWKTCPSARPWRPRPRRSVRSGVGRRAWGRPASGARGSEWCHSLRRGHTILGLCSPRARFGLGLRQHPFGASHGERTDGLNGRQQYVIDIGPVLADATPCADATSVATPAP